MTRVIEQSEILELLRGHAEQIRQYKVERLGLFGSAVRGELNHSSDLDFVVSFREVSYRDYLGLKRLLEDLLERDVDLVFEDSIKPRLREQIMDEVVYVEGL